MIKHKPSYCIYALLIIAGIFISACGQKSESISASAGDAKLKLSSASFSSGDCIQSYQSKYDELLTLEDIQKHYTLDIAIAEKKYRKSPNEKYRNHDAYTYAWASDRTVTIDFNGNKMTAPVENQIGLQWVGDDLYRMSKDKSPLENFHGFYRNASQEEIDKAMAVANAQVKKMEGVTEEQANAATDVAKGISAKTRFKPVEGIGDAASWVVQDNYLVVLAGNVTFQVIADIGGEEADRIDLAKKLAAEVLTRCK